MSYNGDMGEPTAESALAVGDQLLRELEGAPKSGAPAPTMGRLQRVSYTHQALIDLIIEQPELTQNQLAAHFGYTPGWISNILASDAFKEAMAGRREEILDPALKATVKERFEALTIQSLMVLQRKLSQDQVSDQVALRAAELGAKALGVGGHAPPPAPPSTDRLERLASRLLALQTQVRERTINGEVEELRLLPQP